MTSNDILRVAVVGGDGTGPEVTAEAVKVFKAVAALEGIRYELKDFDLGGERFLRTGEILPEEVVNELATFKAILLGAVGHPNVAPGVLEKGLLLALRFRFDQYINLRPVKLFPGVETPLADKGPDDIDFVVVRENTEDMYAGVGGWLKKGTPDEVATQTAIYTRKGCERCIRWAFEFTRKRNKKKQLTLVAKTNVLTYGHDLWWRTFQDVAKEYPDIKADYNHVDACCMWMVKNPEYYDVIVTTNMFGDIITDLAGILQGGMGVAAGGNINPDPGGAEHVRADGRQRAEVHRQERHQPHCRHRRRRHVAGAERLSPGRPAGDEGRASGHRHEDEEPGRRQDGLRHRGKSAIWSAKPSSVVSRK